MFSKLVIHNNYYYNNLIFTLKRWFYENDVNHYTFQTKRINLKIKMSFLTVIFVFNKIINIYLMFYTSIFFHFS